MNWLKLLVVSSIVIGCSGAPKYWAPVLSEQILKPRTGYKGLTFRSCAEYDGDDCKRYKVDEYDLSNPDVRERVREAGLTCKYKDARWRICPQHNGICFNHYEKKCFLFICNKKLKSTEMVSFVEHYQRLIDNRLRCFDEDVYPFNDI